MPMAPGFRPVVACVRWGVAAAGLWMALRGGVLEYHHHLVGGGLLTVTGLVVFVLASGSTVSDPTPEVARAASAGTGRGKRRPKR
jgi:hypothetical protein